jgi:hypothetical protein
MECTVFKASHNIGPGTPQDMPVPIIPGTGMPRDLPTVTLPVLVFASAMEDVVWISWNWVNEYRSCANNWYR